MGYSANIEKPVGKNGSVMTDYSMIETPIQTASFFRNLFRQ